MATITVSTAVAAATAVAAENAARVAHLRQAILVMATLAKDCASAQESPEPRDQLCVRTDHLLQL